MNKSQYKFTEKINKCDVIIKSTITKRTICREKKKWLKQLKKKKKYQNRKKKIKIKIKINKKLEKEREY